MALNLPWDNFFWPDFQVLTHHFAEWHLPGVILDEYLKHGNKQHGIDLIQRNTTDGRGITIQCKREKQLTKGDLEKLVTEFLEGDYRNFTSTFYLATSADLQGKKLNLWLEEKQRELKETYNIGFIWWDIYYLERHLKNKWSLVAKHFDQHVADSFCYKELRIIPSSQLKPVKNSIPRMVERIAAIGSRETAMWFIAGANAIDLSKLFTKDRQKVNRICLIAEPYQGKSTLLRQSAFDMGQAGLRIQPIFIDLKKEIVRPIEAMLNDKYGVWKDIPDKDLVLYFDGADETVSARFLELVRHINTFAGAHPIVSVVVSCRGMFYHRYDLSTELPDFELYQLCPMEARDIDVYAKTRLGTRQAAAFLREVNIKQLSSWLYHPFYLVNLVDQYKQAGCLPESKQQVIDGFISKSLERAGDRVLNSGERLSSQSTRFRAVAEKLAICMQLLGKNALSKAEFQDFFDSSETELLQHSSFISYHRQTWTFTNAFLQEHLAASYLCNKSFEEITNLVAVGRGIRKIRTKWIQTLHSLLSLLPKDSDLFRRLLQFMEEDSLELVFRTDPSLHTDEFRLNALKKLLDHGKESGIWPQIVPTEAIAAFMNGVPGTVGYLTGWIKDPSCPELFKRLCCRLLSDMDVDEEDADAFLDLVHRELFVTVDVQYAAELVKVLAAWRVGNEDDIRSIIGISNHSDNHPFRNRVYEWITALEFNSEFWGYGLEGVPVLIAHNKPISQGGSESPLESFFLTVRHRSQLYSLFKVMGTHEWLTFYRFKGSRKEGFVYKLMEKCIQLHENDHLVFLPVSNFIRAGGQHRSGEDSEVMQFVNATQTHGLMVQRLGPAMFSDNAWQFGPLLTRESIDYLIWLFEEGDYKPRGLQIPLMGLSGKETAVADEYRESARGTTARELFSLADAEVYKQMQEASEKRLKNDLKAIQSIDSFRKAVKRFFSLFKKKTFATEDLFWDQESDAAIAGSPFIFAFLREWIMPDNNNQATLKSCLAFLEKEDHFEYFRAVEILEYHVETEETKQVFAPIIRGYYDKYLPRCTFGNTYRVENGLYYEKPVEILIGKIFDRYEFKTPEKYLVQFIWLDRGGFGDEGLPYQAKTETFRGKIIRHLGDNGEHLLSDAVLSHLKAGINYETVLVTHLALCQSLKIRGTKKLVLEAIQKRSVDQYRLHRIVDIYVDLGGKKENLLAILETLPYQDVIYEHLLRVLAGIYPDRVADIAMTAMASGELQPEEGLKLAQLLTGMGRPEGFRFQVDLLRQARRSTMRLQTGQGLDKIDTSTALDMFRDLMYMTVNPVFADIRPPENPKYVLFDWLSGLAGKGETDLLLVIDFLQDMESSLRPVYPDVSDLRWYQGRILEKFRSMQEEPRTVAEIRRFIQQIPDATTPQSRPTALEVK